jgi:hypothetical protein
VFANHTNEVNLIGCAGQECDVLMAKSAELEAQLCSIEAADPDDQRLGHLVIRSSSLKQGKFLCLKHRTKLLDEVLNFRMLMLQVSLIHIACLH